MRSADSADDCESDVIGGEQHPDKRPAAPLESGFVDA